MIRPLLMHRTRGALGVVAGRVACLKCCKVAGVGSYIGLALAPAPAPPPITDPMLSGVPFDPPDGMLGYSYTYDAGVCFTGSVATYDLNNAPSGLGVSGLTGVISGTLGEMGSFPDMSVTAQGADGPITTPVSLIEVVASDGALNAATATATPTMASNTAPFGVVTFSSDPQIDQAFRVFDKNNGVDWISSSDVVASDEWVAYEFNAPIIINKYTIRSSQVNGDLSGPFDFKLQGSHDGITWFTLGTETAITYAIGGANTFVAVCDAYYLRYRVLASSINGAANMRIAELSLIEGQTS